MKKRLLIFAALLLLLVIGYVAISQFRKARNTPVEIKVPPRAEQIKEHLSEQEAILRQTGIVIGNNFIDPVSLTVTKGTTITWKNRGNTKHQLISDSGPGGVNSSSLDIDQSYSKTFDSTGTFNYHSSQDSNMKGTVIVIEE